MEQIVTPEPAVKSIGQVPEPDPGLGGAAAELTVVIPTFCERENVAPVIARVGAVLAGVAWEIVFVDDDSPDGTAAEINRLGAEDARVRCIRRIGRRGLAGACIEGMLASQAPYVAVMDADLQHDERLLADMLDRLRNGYDVAVGSRRLEAPAEGLTSARQSGSRMANTLVRKLFGIDVSDPMTGFFMLRRSVIEDVAPHLSPHGFKLLVDILASAGKEVRVVDLPFDFRPRQHGESKLDSQVMVDFLELLVAKLSRGYIPDRFVSFMLVGLSGIGMHLIVLALVHYTTAVGFTWAQVIATIVAMASNFFLNNALTYRAERFTGINAAIGLIVFSLICSVGVVSNIGVAHWIYMQDRNWWFAGLLGSVVSAVWNYAVSRTLVWRVR